MTAQANRLSAAADNVANVTTPGYKSAVSSATPTVLPSTSGLYIAGGLKTNFYHAIAQQGPLQFSSSSHDLAVSGDGFFVVQNAAGETSLTRSGSFVPDGEGRLVNAAGFHLMAHEQVDEGQIGNDLQGLVPVKLDPKVAAPDQFRIGEDGMVTVSHGDGSQEALYQIPLATVQSPDQMRVLSGNTFAPSAQSGDVELSLPGRGALGSIVPGALEASNVDMTREITGMIEAEHLFVANALVMQMGSELLETLLDLKK